MDFVIFCPEQLSGRRQAYKLGRGEGQVVAYAFSVKLKPFRFQILHLSSSVRDEVIS